MRNKMRLTIFQYRRLLCIFLCIGVAFSYIEGNFTLHSSFMKNRYLVVIIIAIVAIFGIISYNVELPPFNGRNIMTSKTYNWSFTGESFVTTFSDKHTPVPGAKNTHACLAGNDESCFLITVWTGNYAGYFNAYRIANYETMMAMTGSELTENDLKSQLTAGYIKVMDIIGNNNTVRHLVDIGLEAQHLYTERPWGTIIITDTLWLKGPSYPDRKYLDYIDMPKYIKVH